ncbi:Gfo/Idh/MocA family protein [Litorimonas haliclonae]|uniref:Gfo/Idh/MocA family protein n=1 Tax=Litorimonas haliclonae TaxID=2081977 RepID=UPI0039EFC2C6
MINIGILGAANIAPKAIIHPAQDRDDCQVLAVASRDLEKSEAYAKEHSISEALDDYDALISHPKIDMIYNALPPNRHADLTIAALEAGKSVLCEKPFAMNLTEAKAMVAAAETSDGHLIEAFHYRFHPAVTEFLTLIHHGEIGDVRSMNGRFNVTIADKSGELRYIKELGGGALMDLGCYTLHLSRLVSMKEPEVTSATAILSESGVDAAMKAEMNFDGIKGTLACDMRGETDREIVFTVTGDKGTATLDQYVHPYRQFTLTVETESGVRTFTEKDDEKRYTRSTYAYQLDHVVKVMSGKASALTGGADAIQTMRTIDAIYDAAGMGPR